jgi:hypothetical protein
MPQCKSRQMDRKSAIACRQLMNAYALSAKSLSFVIPAKAGTHGNGSRITSLSWAPACAGVTSVWRELRALVP